MVKKKTKIKKRKKNKKVKPAKKIKKVEEKAKRERKEKKKVLESQKTRAVRKKAKFLKKKKVLPTASEITFRRMKIRVIGVGGGGSSIVSEIAPQLKKVEFWATNTDLQALKTASKKTRLFHFGQNLTQGLGCGMDLRLGERAAKKEKERIAKLFQGVDLVILVACLGGGTGSGSTPEFAKIARELGVRTFGIFTLPFKFEGGKRAQMAKSSLKKLIPNLNASSIIPNENIFQIIEKSTPLKEAFSLINKKLSENLRGLIEMIYLPGLINIDFADLKTILEGRGKLAYLNTSWAEGEKRAEAAVKELLKNPLNEYSIEGAEKIIFNITASRELGMKEVEEISQTISNFNKKAKIIFGVSQNDQYGNKLRITLLAVGCGKNKERVKKKKIKKEEKEKEEIGKEVFSAKIKLVPKLKSKIKPKAPLRTTREKKTEQTKPKKKSQPKIKSSLRGKSQAVKFKEEASQKAPLVQESKKERLSFPTPAEKISAKEKILMRRNALDLRRETEKAEREILAEEKKWEIPAFLRKKK